MTTTLLCTCGHPKGEHAPYGTRPCWFHVGRGRKCPCKAWRSTDA